MLPDPLCVRACWGLGHETTYRPRHNTNIEGHITYNSYIYSTCKCVLILFLPLICRFNGEFSRGSYYVYSYTVNPVIYAVILFMRIMRVVVRAHK